MSYLTIALKGNKALEALRELEQKKLIKILHEPDLNSYCLPGDSISPEDFKNWVDYAESLPTIDLKEARQRWTDQKEKLQKLLR